MGLVEGAAGVGRRLVAEEEDSIDAKIRDVRALKLAEDGDGGVWEEETVRN